MLSTRLISPDVNDDLAEGRNEGPENDCAPINLVWSLTGGSRTALPQWFYSWTGSVDWQASPVHRYMAVQGCVVGDSQHLAGHGRDRSVAMTLRQLPTDNAPQRTRPEHTPRLRLKPKAPQSGFVDGAWWPHSDDLNAELPDVLAVLSVRLGPIDRVLYNNNEWLKPTPKLFSGGRAVRLDGHQRHPVSTVEVIGLDDSRIALLVVPPNSESGGAHDALMAAAAPSDESTVDALLANTVR
jgi:hypothetical protein